MGVGKGGSKDADGAPSNGTGHVWRRRAERGGESDELSLPLLSSPKEGLGKAGDTDGNDHFTGSHAADAHGDDREVALWARSVNPGDLPWLFKETKGGRRSLFSRHAEAQALDQEQRFVLMRMASEKQPNVQTLRKRMCGCCSGVEAAQRWTRIMLRSYIPALKWMPSYRREFLGGDLIAGITVSVLMIPQAISYSALAGLPPEFGLYSSIFPVAVYALLGSSRHMHIGPFAVVSLLVGSACEDLLGRQGPAYTGNDDPEYTDLAVYLCLIVGCQQLLFGILRLGFLLVLLSEPVVSGVTTAAAFFVVTSQVKQLFGLPIPSYSGPGSLFKSYKYLIKHIGETNVAALVIGILGLMALLAFRRINLKFKARLKVPLPGELIVVATVTLLSWLFDFEHVFHLKVVGSVDAGLPVPSIPGSHTKLSLLELMPSAFTIAIVGYIISVSIVKTFGSQLGYTTDASQEFIALGAANIFGSMFKSYPSAGSLSRSAVLVATGGNSPLACLISAAIMIVVVVALIPLFAPLPAAMLASVILLALQGLLMQYRQFFKLIPISKVDAFMWLASFVLTLVFNVGFGVGISVLLNLLLVAISGARPKISTLGWVEGTTLYRDITRYDNLITFAQAGVKIIRFNAPLTYVNRDYFHASLLELSQPDGYDELNDNYTTTTTTAADKRSHKDDLHSSSSSAGSSSGGGAWKKGYDDDDDRDVDETAQMFRSQSDTLQQPTWPPRTASVTLDGNGSAIPAISPPIIPPIVPLSRTYSVGEQCVGPAGSTCGIYKRVSWIVLDCVAMQEFDSTGLHQLSKTYHLLLAKGTRLVLAAPRRRIRESMLCSGCTEEGIQSYASIHAAVAYCLSAHRSGS